MPDVVDATVSDGNMTPKSDLYFPSPEVVANANVPDYLEVREKALTDPVGFWDARAKELIDWYTPYIQVLDTSNAPFFKWYVGGKTNIIHNALDRHIKTATKDKLALIWEAEDGAQRRYTYHDLWLEVNRFANVLKSLNVKKGDTVTIYMGRVPELSIAMLAVAKLGAIHSVVYGGFSEQALADRMNEARSKVLVTCDGAWLRGKTVNLKDIADEAVAKAPVVEKVIVYQRTNQAIQWVENRDLWWHELVANADPECKTEQMDAEDPLFILYTSGTTGKPKGQLHTCGGYQVHIATTLKYVFDIKDEDVWWCAADPGWITGHSYIVYAPLILGATGLMYEGAPGYPNPDRWWELVDKYGVTILYTAPTAIRGFMRLGEAWPEKHPMSTLRLLGSVGEPINPEAWRWYYKYIGKERCQIMDTWWQTETGGFMITPTPAVPLKPGSGTLPFAGIIADVVRTNGDSTDANEDGFLVIKHPWPGMARTIWGENERYVQTYWADFAEQGWYFSGDSARRDEDGYFWVIGRMDDVIKVSGYRLGTAEVESALVSHPKVAEAACVGIPDEIKGNVIHAFCILNAGITGDDALVKELKDHVRHEVGPIAIPAAIEFVQTLPKTRSGKIMRRLLKAQLLGQPIGDTSTLEG